MTGATVLRVLGIVGSPQPGGRTAAAVAGLLAGAGAQGANTDLVELAGQPDALRLVGRIDEADAVVPGAPVYRARAATPVPELIESVPRGMGEGPTAPLRAKACAVVLTGRSDHHFLALDEIRGVLASFFAAPVLPPGLHLSRTAFVAPDRLSAGAGGHRPRARRGARRDGGRGRGADLPAAGQPAGMTLAG